MSEPTPFPHFVFDPVPRRPMRSKWTEYGRPAVLFVVTAVCIYMHGALASDPSAARREGIRLAVAAMAIMLAHEMGHYLACRYYGVDATLPHFLPAPLLWWGGAPIMISLVGTFGAFIRIRGPIPHRRALFDIGLAGPLAGFLVCLPVIYLATQDVQLVPIAQTQGGSLELHNPLLLQLAYRWLAPNVTVPDGMVPVMGSLALAAWFGLFLTALNLMPVGQLDGGHATYALLRRKAWRISRVGWWVCVALVALTPTWILWAILLRLLGRYHPETLDDEAPIGRWRAAIGLLTLAIFVLCFIPNPVDWSWSEALSGLRHWLTT